MTTSSNHTSGGRGSRSFNSRLIGDQSVPIELVRRAKGLAFFTVAKVGFFLGGKIGSGLVVARLPDGRWSAPSAVLLVGLAGGE
jgi:lipid-binding SYLF domain-containing protein